MAVNTRLYFTCPVCDAPYSQIEEMDKDIFGGQDYTALCCGARIRVAVVSMEAVAELESANLQVLPPSKGLRI